jgi:hypothetical protein
MDHLVYKFEIYGVFLGISSKRPEDFSSHLECRLGQWYYEGEGKHCLSTMHGYREMEKPHQQVHDKGAEAVALFYAGDYLRALDAIGEMEKASALVLSALEDIAENGTESIGSPGYQSCRETLQATVH